MGMCSLTRFSCGLAACVGLACSVGDSDAGFSSGGATFGNDTGTLPTASAGSADGSTGTAGTSAGPGSADDADAEGEGDGSTDGGQTTSGGDDNGSTSGVSATATTSGGGDDTTSGGVTTNSDDTTTSGGDTTTSGGGTTSSGGTTGGGAMMEVLTHAGAACNMSTTLWCTDMVTGIGSGQHTMAECFDTVGLSPPFDLTQLTYRIYQADGVSSFVLEVRQWTGSAPGGILGSQTLSVVDANPGNHTIPVNPPITINDPSFCVGLFSNGAFSVDTNTPATQSFRAFLQAPACGANSLTSHEALGFPGNYCLTATIEKP